MTVQKPLIIDNGTTQNLPAGDTLALEATVEINGVTYTWPLANGANQTVLTEDGSGGLAWTTPTGGPPSGAAGPTYLSGTYPDPDVVGLGQKVLWLVEGGKYATLQAAFNAASEGDTIMVGPKATGTWGDLTIAENKTMSIVGLNGPQGKTAKIGAVTFSPTTGGLNINRNEYFFANLMVTGTFASQAVLFSGTGAGRMRFVGCYVDNNSATGDGVVNSNTFNTGSVSSLYLDNCVVQVVTTTGVGLRHSGQYTWIKNRTQVEGGLHAIEQTAGSVDIVGASIAANGALSTVELSGTASLTMGYSTISNSSNAAGAIGVNVNSATAFFGAGNATIAVGSSVLAAGTAVAGTGTFAYTGISFAYASAITVPAANQSQALSTTGWFSTKIKQGISLTAPGSGLLEFNTSGRLNRYNDAVPTNGQVLIGDTAAGYFKAATLTAGTNIAVTNGAGSISVGLSGAIGVTNGGTGLATAPANGRLLIGNGTGYTLANLTAGTGIAITNAAGSITVAASNAAGVQPIASTAVNITLTTANYTMICNSNTGAITVTLPLATGNTGRVFVIKRNGINVVTVGATSNIDGSPTYSLAADKNGVMVQSDGTTWWAIAKA
jgi:hypothetical protein